MLRKLRLATAIVFFTFITLLFLDFSGIVHGWFGWMAKIQFMPAIMALNVGVILFLVILTLLFGRVYCSVICPLGVLQDIIAKVGRKGKKLPYSYSPARTWLRYGTLVVFVAAIILGFSALFAILDPYSFFGRIASNLFAPVWLWGNNLLAYISQRSESYTFYEVDVWIKSLPTLITAIVTLLIIVVLAWRNGRTYCNTICPVGTVLGFLSRYSLFRVTIDTEKCNNCGLCARNCKAACINSKEHSIDNSRCVACMNCIEKCNHSAINYRFSYKQPMVQVKTQSFNQFEAKKINETRRNFFTIATLFATTAALKAQEKGDGGLAEILDKKIPTRKSSIVPAGSSSIRNMHQRCTACQLCVSVCPNQVLRPSDNLNTFMQPEMSYERGYCRPECVKCSEVCPAGAITSITTADKSSIQIGHAVWLKQLCVVLTDKVKCGNCARHCPTNAIQMIPSDSANPDSLKIPVVNVERCIGCGACENLCPSRPLSAIYVEGHERHRVI